MSFKKLFLLGLTFSFLLLTSYFYRNQALAFRFVDEEDNFAIGKYLLRGEVLYEDIITNHQPLTYIFSQITQKYSKPNTTYLLITRHREAIIVWSMVWSLIIVFYFGWSGVIGILIYEFTKIYLLGNLFLAEAQVVYPLMFLGGLVVLDKNKLGNLKLVFSGLCFGITVFLLSPTWPVVFFLFLIILYKHKSNLAHALGFLLIGILFPLLMVYRFTSLMGYLYDTLYVNFVYTIPAYHAESWPITILKAFLSPFLVFFPPGVTPTARVSQLLSLLLIINLLFLIFKKRYYFKVILAFVLLGLSNIRFINPGEESYTGFHLLPWYAMLILLASFIAIDILKYGNLLLRTTNLLLIITVLGLSLNFAKTDLFQKRNTLSDYNINYSTHTNRGEAVRIMKTYGDTLFVSPNAWLVYWQSDVDHLPNLYGYYTWMVSIPEVHLAVLETFSKTPPTYFYCENCKGLDLERFLNKYKEIKNYGNPSMLYVLESKIAQLTNNQLEQLRFYGFSFD